MKIAFSTSGESLEAPLDGRFGRAERFLVYDLDAGCARIVENGLSAGSSQGAGIQAADTIARSGAGAVVTGHCGPNAFRVLSHAGIRVYTCRARTVAEALEEFRAGKLVEQSGPDVAGHHA